MVIKLFITVIVPLKVDYKACFESWIKLQILVVVFVAFAHIAHVIIFNISTKLTCVTAK